ncbi:MAG TPA: indole-3-glycerol phosphate synthase TrpC [Candidatus Polarisedimenticolia bacterium]|nr:indole-3-glycerol phosphate synthase TrpC [Candidatus Polarisedimenticolia bacterium]
MTATPLERFAAEARRRAESGMTARSLADHESLLGRLPPARPFASRLTRDAGATPRVIAEMKRSSPSAGLLRENYAPRQIAFGYARVGAAALSVLTEPDAFGGDLSHLVEVRAAHLPTLRKDFLVTPYQIAESRTAGADAVLLIAAVLPGPALGIMLAACRRYGIEALVEVHGEEELSRALGEGAGLIGVNNRDLHTMGVDLSVSERLSPKIPAGIVKVSESGIRARADLDRLAKAGYDAFLVGEALMREADPGDALWRLMHPEG